jgi:hypothetical protein
MAQIRTSYAPFTLPPRVPPGDLQVPAVLTGGGIGNLKIEPSGVVTVDWVSGNPYDYLGIEDATFDAGT